MSTATPQARVCDRCGYVFRPLETSCPKCARVATGPSAASLPAAPAADAPSREPGDCRELARKGAALAVAAAICFLAGSATIGFALRGAGGRAPDYGALLFVPVGAAIGYLLALPGTLVGCLSQVYALATLVVLELALCIQAVYLAGSPASSLEVVMPVAVPFFVAAFALLSHLIHTRLRRRARLIIDLTLAGAFQLGYLVYTRFEPRGISVAAGVLAIAGLVWITRRRRAPTG